MVREAVPPDAPTEGGDAPPEPVPAPARRADEHAAEEETPSTAEGPTDAVIMVPVTMEAGALSQLPGPPHGPGSNGVAVAVAEPTPVVDPEAESARTRVSRPVELPPARRPSPATIGLLAGFVGLLALALGTFAFLSALDDDGSSTAAATRDSGRALALLSKPSTERVSVVGSQGALVLAVGSGGRAVLVLRGLERAPSGRTYEAWVVDAGGGPPDPAGLFSGGERVVELTRLVPVGATVAVTVEEAVGSDTPTQPLRLVARRG
ncbi:MAG TPA: anti-sigma factor [Gaiellaceae bacterium]|nr:anti-sigma factor [Gaiellaceae bacterium]